MSRLVLPCLVLSCPPARLRKDISIFALYRVWIWEFGDQSWSHRTIHEIISLSFPFECCWLMVTSNAGSFIIPRRVVNIDLTSPRRRRPNEWMAGLGGTGTCRALSFFLSSSVIIKDRQLLLFSYVICHGGRRDQWLTRIKCDLTHHSHKKSTQKHNAGWLKADSLGIDFPCNLNYSGKTWYWII